MTETARRIVTIGAIALAIAACASSSSGGDSAPRSEGSLRIGMSQAGGVAEVDMKANEIALVDTFAVDQSRAFADLPAVFKVLGLPLARRDQARGITVAAGQPRQIEDQPLSRYLECGRGIVAGANADSYKVDLSVETQVVRIPGEPPRAAVKTTVRATAAPLSFNGNTVACETTGRLERRIGELLRAKLANAGG